MQERSDVEAVVIRATLRTRVPLEIIHEGSGEFPHDLQKPDL